MSGCVSMHIDKKRLGLDKEWLVLTKCDWDWWKTTVCLVKWRLYGEHDRKWRERGWKRRERGWKRRERGWKLRAKWRVYCRVYCFCFNLNTKVFIQKRGKRAPKRMKKRIKEVPDEN